MVKSKFFSVFFAFALLIPCLFALAACNNNKSLKDNEITITVADKVYDGSAIAVTATATSGEQPTILYKPANAADTEYTSVAPQNAGQYVVSAVLAETETYNAAAATKNFSITPKEVTLNWQNQQQVNGVYDGQAKVPEVTAGNLVQGDVCAVDIQVTNGKSNVNAGNFTFSASSLSNANYKLPTDVVSPEYTITQKEVTLSWQEPASTHFEYSGEAKLPQVTANGLVAGDTCAVTVAVTQGQDNINVGNFTCTASGLSNANYKLPENVVSDEYAIAKYVLTGEHVEFTYNGETTFTADLGSIRQGLTLDITFESKNVGAYPDPTQMVFKLNGDASVNANYEVKTEDEGACEAEIVAKEIELNWQDPATTNFVYDGTEKTVTVTIADGQLIGSDTCNASPYVSSGNCIRAGTFTMIATLDNTNYKVASSSASSQEYTIAPKEVALVWQDPLSTNFVYDGTEKTVTVTVDALSLVGTDTCTVTVSVTNGEDNVNVGTFTFTATGLSNTNYKLPTTVESEDYTIEPQLITGQNVEFQYNGETVQVASLSVIETGLTIELIFDNENVGANVVNWVFKSNEVVTDNFELDTSTCTAEIVQKELTPVWTAPFLKYNTHEKVPTCTLSGVLQGEECNVEIQLVPGGDNVSVAGTFRYQATLTGADHYNYCIVNVESPEYTIVAPDSLELNSPMANYSVPAEEVVMFGAQVASDGTYEIILNGFRSNVYQYVQFMQIDQNTGIHPVANVKKGFHAYENLNNVTYNYICFEAEANKQYMLLIDQTGASAVTNGYIELIPHDHYYSFYEDLCYCDHFTGTTLAVGTAQNNLSGDVGSKLSFRFYAQEDHYYYITQSLLGTSGYDVCFSNPDGGEDQAFDQGFVNAFGASNAVKATDDAWVYIYYTAPVAFANGSITIHDDVDAYGFRNGTYVGKTVGIDEVVEIPNLASGETMFLRFAVNNGKKYGYTKYDNLSSTSGEIEFYVKEGGTWEEQTNITWGNGNERTLDNVADDGYCYVIITSDGNCAGQISILLGPDVLM